jgi:hypothetical protein
MSVASWSGGPFLGCDPDVSLDQPEQRIGGDAGKLTAGLLTLTGGEGDVTHGGQMAYTLPPVAYGSGKPKRAPPPEPLAPAEARVSQVEAELRLNCQIK